MCTARRRESHVEHDPTPTHVTNRSFGDRCAQRQRESHILKRPPSIRLTVRSFYNKRQGENHVLKTATPPLRVAIA
eukprot:3131375-Pyramimonas_sp.AAC.1